MLLGILDTDGCIGSKVLASLSVSAHALRSEVETRLRPRGQSEPHSQVPFTPAAKAALMAMMEEGSTLGQKSLNSGHLLVGLARADGISHEALRTVGLSVEALRARAAEASLAGLSFTSRSSSRASAAEGASLTEAIRVLERHGEHFVAGQLRVAATRLRALDSRVAE
jgi:ATP-dependent Clp protease ATP-binding subunit ClpA